MNNTAPIEVVAYDDKWPESFVELQRVIGTSLRDLILTIEHVGSTAVPGLPAKPIIDIDIVLDSAALLAPVTERLGELGYRHQGDLGITGREAFARLSMETPYDGSRTVWPEHHLYVCIRGERELLRHLYFRDYLRGDPQEARRYGTLKLDLARRFRHDREAYTTAKTQFIEEIFANATHDA